MAIIIITHDLGVVAEIADEVAVMYAGRIVERGATKRIFGSPQHPYTWGLLKPIPRLDRPRDQVLVTISVRPPSLINRPSGCHFHCVPDAHTRTDPQLQPVPGDPSHQAACLLDAGFRKRIWEGLRAGQSPTSLRPPSRNPRTPFAHPRLLQRGRWRWGRDRIAETAAADRSA